MTPNFTLSGAASPLLDLLEGMDDDTLNAVSELVDLQVRLTGAPVLVLPPDPGLRH